MPTEVFANSPVPGREEPIALLGDNGGQITAAAQAFNLEVPLPLELQSGGQFRVLVDNELMIVPCQAGTSLSGVTRGAEGSLAVSHSDGADLYPIMTSGALAAAFVPSGLVGTTLVSAAGAEADLVPVANGEGGYAWAAQSGGATGGNIDGGNAFSIETVNIDGGNAFS